MGPRRCVPATKNETLAYLVVLEPLWSPILKSQVVDLLCKLPKERREKTLLVWFYRPDWLFRYQRQIRECDSFLAQYQITLIKLPLLARRYNARLLEALVITFQVVIGLLFARITFHVKTFHCRSYVPSLSVAILKRVGAKSKLIFDPRSAFPEENVVAGRWSDRSLSYRYWKWAERFIVAQSNVVVAVTAAMQNNLCKRVPRSGQEIQWKVIPNNFSGTPRKLVDQMDDIAVPQLCYSGSLGSGYWNNTETYLTFISRVLSHRPRWKVAFLVPEQQAAPLAQALTAAELPSAAWTISSVDPENVASVLSGFTTGLQIMRHQDSRMGIKVAEYLAAGLPVLTSENVLGASEIVRKYDVGFVLKDDYSNFHDALTFVERVFEDRARVRDKCQAVAQSIFSTQAVAAQYEAVYCGLVV